MAKQSSTYVPEISCNEKCKFIGHGKIITSAITKLGVNDKQLACYISGICKNFGQVLDEEGKSALHVAASCGRRDLCRWLVKTGKADLNLKDQESGYTPLHRSMFYGHINNAVFFIEMGAQVQVMDKDDLQANDHAMKDRLIKQFSVNNPCQVYVWGTNNNYTLGTGNQQSRAQPDLLDFFRKTNTSIKQVVMDKFHSVFVSSAGRAWACGHGQGGRLGVDSEQTVLTPQMIKTGVEVVVSASVGRNHTVLLMESGMVWTCGSNTHHVLGHNPPPTALSTPRPIHSRLLKCAGGPIVGIAAARYHSVLWSDTVVLTFGLNGGQLGHPQLQDKTVIVPKQVTGLGQKCKVVDVAASVGATVVCVTKGEIYLLHNYQLRRIACRVLDITKASVFGGELNAEVDQKLTAKGGEELKVMVLTSTGKVLLWQESFPQLTRCIYPLKRSLTFCGVFLCLSNALLITTDGEAYMASVKHKVKKKVIAPSPKAENMSFNQFIEKLDCHHLFINRLPHVHRAVDISADPKGQNFIVIQENPSVNLTDIPLVEDSEFTQQMAALLRDAHQEDSLHDVLFEVDKGSVPAHHFMLARVSEEFANLPRTSSIHTLKLKGVHLQVLNQVLCFVYTHDCPIIHPGPFNSEGFKGDIIKAAFDLAKRLKVSILIKCLHLLRFEDGLILLKEGELQSLRQILSESSGCDRSMFPSLYDVSVASSDGATFKAHKCVLAARLDYFNNMFTGGWLEADATTNVSLPIPQTVLREVIDFLYTNDAPSLTDSQDVDFISSVLVMADQLFISRLKQICEVALSGNLSLRNVAYLLQFAITYNSDQLKSCCMQFISLNLAAVLESRTLEILDSETLEELSRYYRGMIPAMSKRVMTPFSSQVTDDDIIERACPITWFDSEDFSTENEIPTAKLSRSNPTQITGKKRSPRYRKTSESQRKRFESVSSNSDLDCSTELSPTEKMDFDDLVERNQAKKPEEWVTVDKTQKTVQNRLKAIAAASTIQPTAENFTRLVPSLRLPQPYIDSPPLQIQDNKHFPELSAQTKGSPFPKSCNLDPKRSPVVKLSQKQRKKLLAGVGEGVKEESEPPVMRTPWATLNNSVDCSLTDIMSSPIAFGSPPNRFVDIVAEEIQQRDNWSKMKSKSLQLTQIEDKAMEELLGFYNAANIFDERITVERVLSANIAKPIWITSHHQ